MTENSDRAKSVDMRNDIPVETAESKNKKKQALKISSVLAVFDGTVRFSENFNFKIKKLCAQQCFIITYWIFKSYLPMVRR